MGLLARVEDRPTPSAVYNWRVYTCAAIAGSAAIMIGYDSAFIGTTIALTSFKEEFGLDTLSTAKFAVISENIVSLYQAGAFFGALLAYIVGHFIGRKRGLAIFSGIFFLGAGLMLGANGSRGLGFIYGGRVLAGLGVGGASNLTPIYISEVAPPAIRGRLVGFYELSWQIGGLVGFWINYGVNTTMAPSHKQWLIPFAIQLIPAAGLFLGSFWLRESPRWLFSKDKREQALKNLSWIRHLPLDDVYMKEEVYAIDTALEEQRSTVGLGFWQPFKKVANDRKTLYRFFLGASLFFWQNGSGINAINYYSPTIFKSIGITGLNAQLFTTGLFGVVKTCLTLIWLFYLVDKWGRRNILMVGATGGSLCMWYVGGFIAIADPTAHPSTKLSSGGISAVFFFYLWTAFYTPSWNGTPWVYNSEMFDQNVRTLAQASAAANNWLWNFLISRFTPQMFVKMGFGVYFFFATLMLLSVPFVFFLLPETKSIPLEAIDRLFDRKHAIPRKAHGVLLQELRAEEAALRAGLEGESLADEKQDVVQVENRV